MKRLRPLFLILLFGLMVVSAWGILYLWFTPRLLSVEPAADAASVPSGAVLRLRFSRPMQPDSVQQRLSITPFRTGQYAWQGSTLVFTPDQPWVGGETVSVQLEPGAQAAGSLSLPLRDAASWSFTVARPGLLYLYPADGPANIYRMDPFNGESLQLTEALAGVLEFHASADGSTIYFSARTGDSGSSLYRLQRGDGPWASVNPRGEGTPAAPSADLLLDCPLAFCRAPQVSPQGDFLAYERTAGQGEEAAGFPQVWLLPISGSAPAEVAGLTPTPPVTPTLAGDPEHQTYQPVWSQAGLLSFYDSSLAAFILLDPRTGQRVQFPNETGQPGAWEPTGRWFIAPELVAADTADPNLLPELAATSSSRLIEFDRQDGTTKDLTRAEDLEDASPAFSPDGSTLAFARKYLDVSRWTPGRQLWLMRADGSGARALTQEPFYNHYQFAWSPTGDRLAFVRFNQTELTEPPEIWMVDPVTASSNRLVVGGYAPQWIP